jgi:hypothetical protein
MARQFALLRAFRQIETPRVTAGAVVGVTATSLIAALVGLARPGPIVTAAAFALAAASFAVLTFAIAAVLRPRQVSRALTTYRWVARYDWLRWRHLTGETVPRTPARARSWLEQHSATGDASDLARIELLVWIGEFDAAGRVVATLPDVSPWDRFERALQRAFVDFVASGDGDLSAAREAIRELPADQAPAARAMVAVEEARQRGADWLRLPRDARGRALGTRDSLDWLEPLDRERDALGPDLDGFLLPDLARWTASPLLAVGAVSALTTFLVGGALPPR